MKLTVRHIFYKKYMRTAIRLCEKTEDPADFKSVLLFWSQRAGTHACRENKRVRQKARAKPMR